MPTTVTVNPTYAVSGKPCEIIFTRGEVGSNFVRVWITVAPEASEYHAKIERERKSRIEVYAGNGGASFSLNFTADKGGKYTFVAQEYAKGNAAGPGYQDDPRGAPTETKIGSETTLSVYFGQRLTQQLGTGGDTAKLVLWVWDDTIRPTTIEQHGEVSPGVEEGSPSSARAKLAAESSTVLAALAALINVSAATAIGNTNTVVSDIVTRWNIHLASAVFHENADGVNLIPVGFGTAGDPMRLKEFVNDLAPKIRRHYTNADATDVVDSAQYHDVGGKKNDWTNLPLVTSTGTVGEAYAALADFHRSYEAHRPSLSVHDSADGTALTALPLLLAVHSAFFAVLAATSPTPPPAQSTAAALLVQQAGFEET